MRPSNPPEIKALFILHIALLAGQVAFALIALLVGYIRDFSSIASWQSYSTPLIILCISIGIAGYLGGNILFRKKLDALNENSHSLSEKFNNYRAACIMRWAMLEFPVLFCIIFFFVTDNFILLIVAAALILLFITTRPSLQKAASDLRVSETEIEQMNTGGAL
ncbi:MAG: hypothetical protein ABI237_03495 [Ginsengibacter sp.]